MNAILGQPFCRLLWKEWRSVRGFAIALLIFGLGLLWFSYDGPERGFNRQAEFIIPMVPIIALMGIVATTFAAEHEHQTANFQRSLPISQTTVVASKLLIGVAVSVALAILMMLVARLTHRYALSALKPSETILAACELLAWGTLVSLLSRRALVALVVSSLIAVGVAYLVQWMISPNLWDPEDPRIWYVPATRWTIVGLVSLASVAVGSAWFNDRSSEITSRLTGWKRVNDQAVASRSTDVRTGLVPRLSRLAWCQVKADLWMWVGLVAALCIVTAQFGLVSRSGGEVALLALVAAAVLGCVATSKNESERHFLSTQSISPGLIWLGSLLLPAVILALVSLAMWLSAWHVSTRVLQERLMYALGAPVLGLAVGQLFSRLTRSSVTAFGIAMLTGAFAAAWLAFAVSLRVPLLYAVLPFVILSLLATFITTRPWLYGWSGRDVTCWKYGSIAACLILSLGVFGWFRATELPAVPATKLASFEMPATPPRDKVRAFRELGEAIERELERSSLLRAVETPFVNRIVQGLEKNRYAFPARTFTSTDQNTLGNIISLLSEAIRRSVEKDNSEQAERRIRAIFAAGEMMKQSGFGIQNRWGGLFAYAYQPILAWAHLDSTSPDQVTEILDLAFEFFLTREDREASIAVQADKGRRLADGDLELLPEYYDRYERSMFAFGIRLPWERMRVQRYVDTLQSQSAEDLETFTSILTDKPFPTLPPYTYDDQRLLVDSMQFSIPDLRSMLMSLRNERAFVVRLALIRYQKLHDGNLPDSILELEDQLPADVLIDPLQGRPFILIRPEAISDWISANERPGRADWEPDPMARYREAILWSPDFYAELTPQSTPDEMFVWIDEDHQMKPMPVSLLLERRGDVPVQSHVPGEGFAGTGTTYSLSGDY